MFRRVPTGRLLSAAAAANPFKSRLAEMAAAHAAAAPGGPAPPCDGDSGPNPSPAEVLRDFMKQVQANEQKLAPTTEDSKNTFKDSRRNIPEASDAAALENWRRRLVYQSRYRGMVEMDLVLGSFAERLFGGAVASTESADPLPAATDAATLHRQLTDYDAILREFDNELHKWLIEGHVPPERLTANNSVWPLLMEHVKKQNRTILMYR